MNISGITTLAKTYPVSTAVAGVLALGGAAYGVARLAGYPVHEKATAVYNAVKAFFTSSKTSGTQNNGTDDTTGTSSNGTPAAKRNWNKVAVWTLGTALVVGAAHYFGALNAVKNFVSAKFCAAPTV